MPRRLAAALLCAAALIAVAPAGAPAAQSQNVKVLATLPEMASAISINFIDDVMFVSTATGIFAYSLADPAAPALLGALPMAIWENEDVDVDRERKLLFVSRDPRGFTTPAAPGSTFPYGAVHIIDVSLPHAMTQRSMFLVPAGHTTTCVNDCDVLWTGGPYANPVTQPDFTGRPIYATDVTDPADPQPCPEPIDTGRNDGVTDYVHDVQVDAAGVAWVSGAGGVRGYWTRGRHRNPLTGRVEEATGCRPIPYAGSGTPDTATPSRFMHNAWRDWVPGPPAAEAPPPPGAAPAQGKERAPKRSKRRRTASCRSATAKRTKRCRRAASCRSAKARRTKRCRRAASRRKAGRRAAAPVISRNDVLFATEEALESDCATSGRFVAYDLRGSYDGEGFRDIATTKHRLRVLDTWTPEDQEGATGCDSSHYFTSRGDGITANAFYGQGVRFLDTSDPTDIRQVGFYVGEGASTWAAYWRDGLVYVADFARGVEVLEFSGGPGARAVRAPTVRKPASRERLRFDRGVFAGLCPLPATARR